MTSKDELDRALERLAEEQQRVRRLSEDYATIRRSRFYALRMAGIAIKGMLRRAGGAAWDARSAPPQAVTPSRSHALEQQLFAAWAARCSASAADAEPVVTVVIPVFNQLEATIRCLQSIADVWFDSLPVQVVVVDDASSDRTPEVLPRVAGVDYIRSSQNGGFVRACNRGASIARGKYICFLNNDTTVRDAWLDYLVVSAESDPSIGAIGSKLVYPDGTLQEAGAIIWSDATGWNYGRTGDPEDPAFNFRRDVDYCSGAALMVRRDLFERLGGFSKTYEPAYYEDVDLCFGVRSLGYRVVYEPRSVIVHYEGVSSGRDITSGTKRFQEINRPKFRAKWEKDLANHANGEPSAVHRAARWRNGGETILVVDSYVPMHDREAGSNRLMALLRILREARYNVIFLPDNYAALQPYTEQLQALGIEVLYVTENGLHLNAALDRVLPYLDAAWICRPELFAKYASLIRRNPKTRVFYDTIDLHFVRQRRETELFGLGAGSWQEMERVELSAARKADATIVVTEEERKMLLERDIDPVYVVPTLHDPDPVLPQFSSSSGLLFIGGYNHAPNADAAKWLCNEVMPLVWERLPEVTLTLLGSSPTEAVRALASERVIVPGYVTDVNEYFRSSRVFVAPLRYGAGMKGKVGQALSHSLPCVLTPIAAEGFSLQHGRDCLIATDPQEFAEAIIRLYSDEKLWHSLSASGHRCIAPFGTAAVKPKVIAMMRDVLASRDLSYASR